MSTDGGRTAPGPSRPAVLGDDELAASWCFDRATPPIPRVAPRDPRSVLEEEVLRALRRSPCVVAFSGGCDSSSVLSLAVHVARREGLPEPVPVTLRYATAHPDDNEDAWQEHVIRELGVGDWERIDIARDEIIGEASERACARVGVTWPPFLYSYEPVIALAEGGAMLTGEYGDDVTLPWAGGIVSDLFTGRRRPSPRAVASALGWVAPEPLRAAIERRRQPDRPWLREPLRTQVRERSARDQAQMPWRADRAVRQALSRRHSLVWMQNMRAVAGTSVEIVHPFARQELLDAVARRHGARGPATRAAVLDAWFGDCAPAKVRARTTRVGFDSVFWGEACQRFAESWEPRWWPSHLVDPEALRATWLSDGSRSGTWTLMQLAWWSTRCEQGDPPRTLGEIARARPRTDDPPGG